MRSPEWLPPGVVVRVEDRGEVFVRVHRHPDPAAPVLLLLHGWSASADTQWVFTYADLCRGCTVIAPDHHGHGRGLRSDEAFDLERVADDAAAVARALDCRDVIAVGYSMGGPLSMLLWRRHRDLVSGVVLAGTAMEWSDKRWERWRWRLAPLFGPALRSWLFPRLVRRTIARFVRANPALAPWVPWFSSEILRNDPFTIASAGRALSRYDARAWAREVDVPAAAVLTGRDRLVPPAKQRALAEAIRAEVFEIPADHFCSFAQPEVFTRAICDAVRNVAARRAAAPRAG